MGRRGALTAGGDEDEDSRTCRDRFLYGSTTALGVSSTWSREEGGWIAEEGFEMSNLRKPSWPCVFAFLVIGCANVRPEDVSARR